MKETNYFIAFTACILLSLQVSCLSVYADDQTSSYLFRFKVPVNISVTQALEERTESSEIKVQCDVYTASNVQGATGFKIIELKGHQFNGTLTVDVNSRTGNTPLHLMSTYRCALLAREIKASGSNSFSETSIQEYASPGSKIVITGDL